MEIISNLQIIEDADQKIYMTFWKLNRKKIIGYLAMLFIACAVVACLMVGNAKAQQHLSSLIIALLGMLFYISFVLFYPSYHAFKVMDRLQNETSILSILTLLDSGYSLGLLHENSKLQFVKPCIHATIRGLPVKIYCEVSKGDGAGINGIHVLFWPLMKDGSKRIFSDYIVYNPLRYKRRNEDVRPRVLAFIEDLKRKGFSSGGGRPISSKHVDTYDV